jgi:hypothetical protein
MLKCPINILPTPLQRVVCSTTPFDESATHLLYAACLPLLVLAVAVIGDICSGATVAAAGVAGDAKVPLISPAASSPQLSNMQYFYRTVPSDR